MKQEFKTFGSLPHVKMSRSLTPSTTRDDTAQGACRILLLPTAAAEEASSCEYEGLHVHEYRGGYQWVMLRSRLGQSQLTYPNQVKGFGGIKWDQIRPVALNRHFHVRAPNASTSCQ